MKGIILIILIAGLLGFGIVKGVRMWKKHFGGGEETKQEVVDLPLNEESPDQLPVPLPRPKADEAPTIPGLAGAIVDQGFYDVAAVGFRSSSDSWLNTSVGLFLPGEMCAWGMVEQVRHRVVRILQPNGRLLYVTATAPPPAATPTPTPAPPTPAPSPPVIISSGDQRIPPLDSPSMLPDE